MDIDVESRTFSCWKPARRKFPPDHPFFNAGNVERELLAKQVSLNLSEEEKACIGKIEDEQCWIIPCPIVGCGAKLKGLEELESHYSVRHKATCSVCSHVFPTKRLLSLHISETHDSFFKAKVARNFPMYLCLVDGCPSVFMSDGARHQHLVQKHKFPQSFQFHKKTHPSQRQRQKARVKKGKTKKHSGAGGDSKDEGETEGEGEGEGEGREQSMDIEVDELSHGVSRLSTADGSNMPTAINFGRRNNKGLRLTSKKT